MRIVFDVLGSTEKSGGMRLHSTEIIRSWITQWPDDEVTIVGPAWAEREFRGPHVRVHRWRNERALDRSLGQIFGSASVARRESADALVSLSPVVSPFRRGVSVCFQHDWRHKINPNEFPRIQRIYRWLWQVSARNATFNACISQKACNETERFASGARTVLIPNGWDHARAWPAFPREGGPERIVTFGHHNNKRPELVIEALSRLNSPRVRGLHLSVLGARGPYAADLRSLARDCGVADRVDFPGFVTDEEYQRTVSNAAVIVMPSSDEGFGLPVAEALFLGVPTIVTSDSGMGEIFGDAVVTAAPSGSALAEAIEELLSQPSRLRADKLSRMTTWDEAADRLRTAILAARH